MANPSIAHAALIPNPKARFFDLVREVMRFHHYARRFDCRRATGSFQRQPVILPFYP